jgi:hypothetical protein
VDEVQSVAAFAVRLMGRRTQRTERTAVRQARFFAFFLMSALASTIAFRQYAESRLTIEVKNADDFAPTTRPRLSSFRD